MKKGFHYIVLFALILLEILLVLNFETGVANEAANFWKPVWTKIAPGIIFLILPLLIAALLVRIVYSFCARMGWGIKPKLRIRPFDCVMENSRFNGKAASILLFKELAAFISSEQQGRISKNVKPGSRNTQAPSFKLVGATVPFQWIRTNVRKYLGITDYEVRGLIDDSKDKINITAWSSDYLKNAELIGGHWEASSAEVGQEYSFDDVVVSLATRIAEEITPRTTAMLYWNQFRYAESVEILSSQLRSKKSRTAHNHSDLGWLYYESDYYSEAVIEFGNARQLMRHRLFDLFNTQRSQVLEEEISWGWARAYADMGIYDQSIELLEDQMRRKESPRILIELGTTCFLKGYPNEGLEKSLSIYEEAERLLIDELQQELERKVTLESTKVFMVGFKKQLLDEVPLQHKYFLELMDARDRIPELINSKELATICRDLADLYIDRSRALFIHRGWDSAKVDIEKSVVVLTLFSHLDSYLFRNESHSTCLENLGQNFGAMKWYEEAEIWFREALIKNEEEISISKSEIKLDKQSIASLTNLAWAYCGQYSCLVHLVENIILKFELEYDYFLPIYDTVTDLVQILDFLPDDDQYEWIISFESILFAHDSSEYREALSNTIQIMITAVFENGTEEQQNALLKYSEAAYNEGEESQDIEVIMNALGAVDFQNNIDAVQALVNSLTQSVPFSATQIQTLCIKLILVVDHLSQSVRNEDITDVIDLAQHKAKIVESRKLAMQCFEKLQEFNEIHHHAEANFGAACLYAIDEDAESAIYFLKEAIRGTTRPGSLTSEYRNRAILDSDFDSIRFTEGFRRVLEDLNV